MNGPFEIELKIRLTDGERSAAASYDMPVGQIPTKASIEEALQKALTATRAQVGEDWRLQTRNEFENEVLSERYGGMTPKFATAEKWDATNADVEREHVQTVERYANIADELAADFSESDGEVYIAKKIADRIRGLIEKRGLD